MPTGLEIKAGERHFDLKWDNKSENNLLRYQIYRSWDGENYLPIGIQQGQFNRFEDFLSDRRTERRFTGSVQ